MIVQDGSVNFGALIVPNVFVNIIPPTISYLNGVPSNVGGFVGCASWGPTNKPTVIGDYAAFRDQFGELMARKYDLGTHLALAVINGGKNFRCVRVTDGTDAAATATMQQGATPVNVLVFTGKYTGIKGNLVKVSMSPGAATNTWRIVVALPGQLQEVFDNISGTGAGLYANIVAAVNTGLGQTRGPSNLVVVSLSGIPSVAPVAASVTTVSLNGGTDGTGSLVDSMLIGSDASPRTGMYSLRKAGCAVATLCDFTTLTSFSTIGAFGQAEGIYMLQADAAGQCSAGNVSNVTTNSSTMAIDLPSIKVLAGDWLYWNDNVTGSQRLVCPTAPYMGLLMNLSPEQSGLNKEMFGIAGTQTTINGGQYSDAELQVIAQARFDLITLPSVGGQYYSARMGINTSSNAVIHGDNYWRLTCYIARTFDAALGRWVGQLQTPAQRRSAKAQADAFFSNMQFLGQIGNAEGTTPFKVTLDITNNPPSRVALGYETATAQVQYLSVIEKFILNLEGGQSVQIVGNAGQTRNTAIL